MIKRDLRATKEKSVELEKELEDRFNFNTWNAKPKVVTSTANEVIQLPKSEPRKWKEEEYERRKNEEQNRPKKHNSIRKKSTKLNKFVDADG